MKSGNGPPESPKCRKCGYDLRGLAVDGACPECGTAVWSRKHITSDQISEDARRSQELGLWAILMMAFCLGPLATLIAIPAIKRANDAFRDYENGVYSRAGITGAGVGRALGWITVALSILIVIAFLVQIAIDIWR